MTVDEAKEALTEVLIQKAGLIAITGGPDGYDAEQMASDLLDWLNIAQPDNDDLNKVYQLFAHGNFTSWACPSCGDRVFYGSPEDWGDFQAVHQVDYTSYPGGHPDQCDHCRMHMEQLPRGYSEARSPEA